MVNKRVLLDVGIFVLQNNNENNMNMDHPIA